MVFEKYAQHTTHSSHHVLWFLSSIIYGEEEVHGRSHNFSGQAMCVAYRLTQNDSFCDIYQSENVILFVQMLDLK